MAARYLRALFDVNVKSMYWMTRAVLPQMLANGGGSVVCTSSISAVYATPNEVLYDATKGAVHMFARAIAVEFRDRGIRCNAVAPGVTVTPMVEHRLDDPGFRKMQTEMTPHTRLGRVDDIASTVAFLCSAHAGFITGAAYPVDGGLTSVAVPRYRGSV